MDEKSLSLLEFHKVLQQLSRYCAFSASQEKALALRPTHDLILARQRQAETAEAVGLLLHHSDLTIGGVRDIRQAVDLARHSGVLNPPELLDIKFTLAAARTLRRTFERIHAAYPSLADLALQLPAASGIIDAITRTLSERGEILDSASDRLGTIRRELRIVHDRLLTRLQKMVADPKNTPLLQEALVTLRDGRYVLPLRAEFKGRIKSIVHDQSSSGATLFVEPLAVVEQNNQYRELQLAERDEERRILAELSRLVGESAESLLQMVEVIAELDLILSRARYALDLHATQPVLVNAAGGGKPEGPPPEEDNPQVEPQPSEARRAGRKAAARMPGASRHPHSTIRLFDARHPLLDPQTVVAIDVELDPETFALVITGPNTGGKTVTLKTVGLLAAMAQSGLQIPAQPGSELSVFHNIYADIGDEQSIEQSLSTFSGHITNIVRILNRADHRCLVILDELGAGTDPQEGAALARSLLTHLVGRGITTLVTTHHPELKAYAHATPGVVNASVEFDLETLRPTYHLTIGLPGRSNALAIAQRLGMPRGIIQAARQELSPDDLRAEDLLDEIHRQRDLSRQARQAAEQARQEAEKLRSELAGRLEQIEEERRELLENARQEAAEEVGAVQQELAEARRQLVRLRQPVEALREVEEKLELVEEKVEQAIDRQPAGGRGALLETLPPSAIRLGDKVRLRKLGTQGVVSALGEEEAEVQVGTLRVRARLVELERVGGAEPPTPAAAEKVAKVSVTAPESPGLELDLRGQVADEALDELERYLDAAFVSGLPFVRIIHGKGTGKLREVVRQALKDHPHVRSFGAGADNEGGEGVTVVKF